MENKRYVCKRANCSLTCFKNLVVVVLKIHKSVSKYVNNGEKPTVNFKFFTAGARIDVSMFCDFLRILLQFKNDL